jgi:hypothetical protein
MIKFVIANSVALAIGRRIGRGLRRGRRVPIAPASSSRGRGALLGSIDLLFADAALKVSDELVPVQAERIRATTDSGRNDALLKHDFEFGE